MKFWRLPSFLKGDLVECKCDEPNPNVFKQYFSIKIVPIQLPLHVGDDVVRFVFDVCNNIECKSKVECEMVAGSKPWLEDFTDINYDCARRATIQVKGDYLPMSFYTGY